MAGIKLTCTALAVAGVVMLAGCNGNSSSGGSGSTTGGETTGGATTGGETTGGETTGGETTGGETTGGETTGGSTTGGETGSGSARNCFNPANAVIGTRVNQVIRSTDGASGITLTTTSDTLVNRETMFNGHTALEAVSDVDAEASNPLYSSKSTTKSYYAADASHYLSKAFGVETDVTEPFAFSTTVTIDPAREDRYDLSPGDSYTQTYTVSTTGGPASIPDQTITSKRTYLGRETVTVPAGTFEACKFSEENTVNGSTATSTLWFDVGSGIELKVDADGDISETLSASINGSPID